MALEWAQGNWSVLEGEEAGSGSGSGHGAAERADGRAMLSSIWETEGLQTVGIVVLVVASIKLLHLLGLISFSEGKTPPGGRRDGRRSRDPKADPNVVSAAGKSPKSGKFGSACRLFLFSSSIAGVGVCVAALLPSARGGGVVPCSRALLPHVSV